eukprot:10779502-Ditylum_brightwellii.AAC.1
METPEESGGKRKAGKTAETPSKQSKNKVQLNTQDNKAEEKSVQEQIKEQGEQVLDTTKGHQTAGCLEWNLPKSCKEFNIRNAV